MFISTVAAVVGIGAGLNSMFGSGRGSSQGATNTANPLAPYQQGWAQQLNQLMSNPSSVTNTPGYASAEQAGQQSLQRGMAGAGQTQSGQEQIALKNYGSNFELNTYNQQVQQLGNLSTGNAVSGQQAGQQVQGQGIGNLASGLGGLASIYGGGGNNSLYPGAYTPNQVSNSVNSGSYSSAYDVGNYS